MTYGRMAIPTVGRSLGEFAPPFESKSFEGLTLEHIEIFHGEARIWAEFETSGDAQAFGMQWAAFSRASVFPTLAAALDGASPARSFMDRLETSVAERLARTPERMVIPLAQMLIAKQ